MKLSIGENIRSYRKKNDMTQEAFAERLGVTYQSVSRWENGTTYPDIELIPSIAELLAVSADELLGMPKAEKEKRALQAFDELRRECMKNEYDADKIVEILRDIRRNHLNSEFAWRPWCEGNNRVFRDEKILPEVRLLAEASLEREPMAPHIIQTMAVIEDEEHIAAFLKKHTFSFDCSARALLFMRYEQRREEDRFEKERRYQLYCAFNNLLWPNHLMKWDEDKSVIDYADEFMEEMLSLIRRDAVDDRTDMWINDRINLGLKSAARQLRAGKQEDAILKIEEVVTLLEDAMRITDEVLLPTSNRFLEGMEWRGKEEWGNPNNDPDIPMERMIYIHTDMDGVIACNCIYPSWKLEILQGKDFEMLQNDPEYIALCDRVKALIKTRTK